MSRNTISKHQIGILKIYKGVSMKHLLIILIMILFLVSCTQRIRHEVYKGNDIYISRSFYPLCYKVTISDGSDEIYFGVYTNPSVTSDSYMKRFEKIIDSAIPGN